MKSTLLLLILFLAAVASPGFAQNKSSDWALLMNSGRPALKSKATMVNSFNVYRTIIKPQMNPYCYFEFPCESFGPAMIKRYRLPKGYFLAIDRWIRCSRISPLETFSVRLTTLGKIKESPEDFHFH